MWLQLASSKAQRGAGVVGAAAGGRFPRTRIAFCFVSRRGEGARTEELSPCRRVFVWLAESGSGQNPTDAKHAFAE